MPPSSFPHPDSARFPIGWAIDEGELVFSADAVGQLTLAVSSGNAARLLGVTSGTVITVDTRL